MISGFLSWVPGPWMDEGATLVSAQRSWPSLLMLLDQVDAVHGLYYAVMHLWFELVGASPLTLRAPSAIAVGVATGLLVRLGQRLVDRRAGILAALSFLLLPAVTWMGGEGRSVAMATAAATLVMTLFIEAVERQRTAWWIGYALSLLLSLTVSLLTALLFVVLPLALFVGRASRRQWVAFVTSSLGAGVASVPLLLKVVSQQRQVSWVGEPSIKGLLAYPREVWFPNPGSDLYVVLAWLVLLTGVTWFLLAARRDGWRTPCSLGRRGVVVLLLGWLLLPPLLVTAWALIGTNLYVPRYLMPSAPGLALVIGVGLSAARPRWLAVMALLTQVAILTPPWIDQRHETAKAPTSLVAETVSVLIRPGDAVLFVNGGKHGWTRVARYAYPDAFGTASDLTLGVPADESTMVAETTVLLREVPERLAGVDRVVAIVADEPHERGLADLAALAQSGFVKTDSVAVDQWSIEVFER
ncbi:MAG: glycosyltransferase family 39 protein [Micropruina sp.]|nr:glycosyltransferase family 39 protein [Micropruina sp.]